MRSGGLCQSNIPTPSGIEPATFRFVAHGVTAVLLILEVGFVMKEVVMRIGLNTVEALVHAVLLFFYLFVNSYSEYPVMSIGFLLPL